MQLVFIFYHCNKLPKPDQLTTPSNYCVTGLLLSLVFHKVEIKVLARLPLLYEVSGKKRTSSFIQVVDRFQFCIAIRQTLPIPISLLDVIWMFHSSTIS